MSKPINSLKSQEQELIYKLRFAYLAAINSGVALAAFNNRVLNDRIHALQAQLDYGMSPWLGDLIGIDGSVRACGLSFKVSLVNGDYTVTVNGVAVCDEVVA